MSNQRLPPIQENQPNPQQPQAPQTQRPQQLDITFHAKNATFDEGFVQMRNRNFRGRCLLRASKKYIALEICQMTNSDGEELCRQYFDKLKDTTTELFVQDTINEFLSIADSRKLDNFAIAFTENFPVEFLEFKFNCDERAMVKYHWNAACQILHVELQDYETKPSTAYEVLFEMKKPNPVEPDVNNTETHRMRVVYTDFMGTVGGRSIYVPRKARNSNLKYYTLYDETPSLMDLVVDRFKDVARECVVRNRQKRYPMRVQLITSYLHVHFQGTKRWDYAFVLYHLKYCILPIDYHLFIYIGRYKLYLKWSSNDLLLGKYILKSRRRPLDSEDYIVDTKNKVEQILKAIWLSKLKQYTLVFRDSEFSVTMRCQDGPGTMFRHCYNTEKNYNILTVWHENFSHDVTLIEYQLKVEYNSLEQQLRTPYVSPLSRPHSKPGVRGNLYYTKNELTEEENPKIDDIIDEIEAREKHDIPRSTLPPIRN